MKSYNWSKTMGKALLILTVLVSFTVANEGTADNLVWREGSKFINQYDSSLRSMLGHD